MSGQSPKSSPTKYFWTMPKKTKEASYIYQIYTHLKKGNSDCSINIKWNSLHT